MKNRVSKKSKRRLMIFGILSVIAIFYSFVTLIGHTYSYISLKQEESKLKAELVALQDEKANLKIEIEKLNDPEYVARYAKENYLYSSNGEYVIKIDSKEVEQPVEVKDNQLLYIMIGGLLLFAILLLFIRIKKKNSSKKWTVL